MAILTGGLALRQTERLDIGEQAEQLGVDIPDPAEQGLSLPFGEKPHALQVKLLIGLAADLSVGEIQDTFLDGQQDTAGMTVMEHRDGPAQLAAKLGLIPLPYRLQRHKVGSILLQKGQHRPAAGG